MVLSPWAVESVEDVRAVYGAWLDEVAANLDRFGTLQGWYFEEYGISLWQLCLVFQHGIVKFNNPTQLDSADCQYIYRLDTTAASPVRQLDAKCPECGGEIQATLAREQYFSLQNACWLPRDETVDRRFYCENDHVISDDALLRQLPELPCDIY